MFAACDVDLAVEYVTTATTDGVRQHLLHLWDAATGQKWWLLQETRKIHDAIPPSTKSTRAVLKREKKRCPKRQFCKKTVCSSYVQSWLMAIGGWRLVAIGSWSRLAVGGGWQLAVGGGWRLAVGGPFGPSLRAVLSKKKMGSLRTALKSTTRAGALLCRSSILSVVVCMHVQTHIVAGAKLDMYHTYTEPNGRGTLTKGTEKEEDTLTKAIEKKEDCNSADLWLPYVPVGLWFSNAFLRQQKTH